MAVEKSGSNVYIFQNRADAVRLAKKIAIAQQKNRLVAVWEMFKSGITRSVTLPSIRMMPEAAMGSIKADLSQLEQTKLCSRKLILFDLPPGFHWSHGNAKGLSRHVVVRHWTTPAVNRSSLHTALSMKDSDIAFNEYAGWIPSFQPRNGWETSGILLKRLLAPVKRTFDYFSGQYLPCFPDSYRQEKGVYLSDSTKDKLTKGVISASKPHQQEATKATSKNTMGTETSGNDFMVPLSFQKVSSKNSSEWQRRAEKHYLPCIGPAKDQASGSKKFVMFGLHLDKMQQRWDEVTESDNPMHCYKLVSKEQNCAGMSWHLLKAGGSEDYKVFRPLFVTTRTDMERYAEQLAKKLDDLNSCADKLTAKLILSGISKQPDISLDEVVEKANRIPDEHKIPEEYRKKYDEVISHIRSFQSMQHASDGLNPVAQKLTVSLAQLYEMVGDNPDWEKSLEPGLHAFKLLKTKIETEYSQQLFKNA